MQKRLNSVQFLAMRSIGKEPWNMKRDRIMWRFGRKWFHLFNDGVRAPLSSVDGIGGRYGYDKVYDRAWDAAWELENQGLVEVFTVRCCPGTSCHLNDRHEYRLTSRGHQLLEKANTSNRQTVEAPECHTFNAWLFKHLPMVWGRWWSARVLATAICSGWLHAGNPDFTRLQQTLRNTLCLALFVTPGRLPLQVAVHLKLRETGDNSE